MNVAFFAPCTHILTYLLTYLSIFTHISYDIKRGTNLLGNNISSPVDSNRIKASFAKVLPVIGSCEIVAVVQEKLAVVDLNGFSDRKVSWREILFDLFVTELHRHSGICGANVVTVLWNSLARDENWKRISAVVWTVNLTDLHSVVDEIVLNAHKSRQFVFRKFVVIARQIYLHYFCFYSVFINYFFINFWF